VKEIEILDAGDILARGDRGQICPPITPSSNRSSTPNTAPRSAEQSAARSAPRSWGWRRWRSGLPQP